MSDLVDLIVEVDGTDIVVKMPGTTNLAIYHKPNGSPQLGSKVQVGPVEHTWTLNVLFRKLSQLPRRLEGLFSHRSSPVTGRVSALFHCGHSFSSFVAAP